MKEIVHRPAAAALISSLRAIGYSFCAALSDIIDNSIAAEADDISVSMRVHPTPYVAILDNGRGMDEPELLRAMRHGGTGPDAARAPTDLGRFGLGLKTASLSQCRQLTVVTVKHDELAAAQWDLDDIEARDDWVLKILSRDDAISLPHVNELLENSHGTLVLWKKFDRATAGESNQGRALEKLVDDSRHELGLVFHRFLDKTDGGDLTLTINDVAVEPIDPFLRTNKRTEMLPAETVFVEGHPVVVQAYILPHVSDIKEDELKRTGGRERLREGQGFYVYRNRRLLRAGTWFRMLPNDELSKLARVRVDIPNALDHLWDLDVKKSSAKPPEQVRQALKRIIDRIADRSHNVFRERRRRSVGGQITHLWERQAVRGGVCYAINRVHPLVQEALESLDKDERRHVERLLKAIEVGLPSSDIYAQMAADRSVEPPSDQVAADLKELLTAWLKSADSDQATRDYILAALPRLDPFSMYPTITRNLVESMRDAER